MIADPTPRRPWTAWSATAHEERETLEGKLQGGFGLFLGFPPVLCVVRPRSKVGRIYFPLRVRACRGGGVPLFS
jgi:hypothetical protein